MLASPDLSLKDVVTEAVRVGFSSFEKLKTVFDELQQIKKAMIYRDYLSNAWLKELESDERIFQAKKKIDELFELITGHRLIKLCNDVTMDESNAQYLDMYDENGVDWQNEIVTAIHCCLSEVETLHTSLASTARQQAALNQVLLKEIETNLAVAVDQMSLLEQAVEIHDNCLNEQMELLRQSGAVSVDSSDEYKKNAVKIDANHALIAEKQKMVEVARQAVLNSLQFAICFEEKEEKPHHASLYQQYKKKYNEEVLPGFNEVDACARKIQQPNKKIKKLLDAFNEKKQTSFSRVATRETELKQSGALQEINALYVTLDKSGIPSLSVLGALNELTKKMDLLSGADKKTSVYQLIENNVREIRKQLLDNASRSPDCNRLQKKLEHENAVLLDQLIQKLCTVFDNQHIMKICLRKNTGILTPFFDGAQINIGTQSRPQMIQVSDTVMRVRRALDSLSSSDQRQTVRQICLDMKNANVNGETEMGILLYKLFGDFLDTQDQLIITQIKLENLQRVLDTGFLSSKPFHYSPATR